MTFPNIYLLAELGKVLSCQPMHGAGGSDLIPVRSNFQGLKIIEEKVLPLFSYLQKLMIRSCVFLDKDIKP